MRIGLVPTDDRPVNTKLPAMIAAVAGAASVQPPACMLGRLKDGAAPDEVGRWLADEADALDAVVVSLEMLVYGGLIPSRISQDPTSVALSRLEHLLELRRARPSLPLYASSVIMRASDSYSAVEEPDYWSEYGRELHALGGALHRRYAGLDDRVDAAAALTPEDVRHDFLTRRLRNHLVNLEALRALAAGAFDLLLLTSDDTAVHSAGSLEHEWLAHWATVLGTGERARLYPGADEIGSTLTARALAARAERPVRFWITCPEPGGLDRIAAFENAPLGEAVVRQVTASGGAIVDTLADADVALVLHAPSADRDGWFGGSPPPPTPAEVLEAVTSETARLVGSRTPTALADLRHTNGGDPRLVDALRAHLDLLDLAAYAGWNTAGNSLGTVVAHATSFVVGRRAGTLDTEAHERLLVHRLVEDCAYQSGVRSELDRSGALDGELAARRLTEEAARLVGPERWAVDAATVAFPWERTFEIDFELQRAGRSR